MSVKEKIKEDHLVDVLEQNLNEIVLYNDDVNNSAKARGLPAASTITLTQDLTEQPMQLLLFMLH